MKTRLCHASASIGFIALLLASAAATGAELTFFSAIGVQEVMEDLAPKFERATGHKVVVTFATLGGVVKRIQAGETADVIVIPAQGIAGFVKEGKAAAGHVSTIARSSVGVAVRKGTPKPDISSPEAFKQSMLAAKSIFISDPAFGGIGAPHVLKVFERLGITEEMKRKTIYTKATGVAGIARALAETDVNVSLNQLRSSLLLPEWRSSVRCLGTLDSPLCSRQPSWAAPRMSMPPKPWSISCARPRRHW